MKDAATCLLVLLLIWCSLIVQEFIPPLYGLDGARVLLVPMFVVYASLGLPFPYMVVVAFLAGWGSDLAGAQFVNGAPELAVGTTIFIFLAVGMICQGLRILFLRGYWWLFSLMSGVSTSALLAIQFILISLRRFEHGGLEFNSVVLYRILVPGVIAFLLAPFVQVAGHFLGRLVFPTEERRRVY